MMQNRQVRLPSRFSVFSLFLAVSICPFETIGNSSSGGPRARERFERSQPGKLAGGARDLRVSRLVARVR